MVVDVALHAIESRAEARLDTSDCREEHGCVGANGRGHQGAGPRAVHQLQGADMREVHSVRGRAVQARLEGLRARSRLREEVRTLIIAAASSSETPLRFATHATQVWS